MFSILPLYVVSPVLVRNITLELCAWGFGNVETFGSKMAHLWRTSQDIAGWVWKLDTFGPKMAHIWRTCQDIAGWVWKLETFGGHLKTLQVVFRN